MLISEGYRDQNARLHKSKPLYGAGGSRFAEHVYGLMTLYRPCTVLDYGAGKGGLARAVEGLRAARANHFAGYPKYHCPPPPPKAAWTEFDPAVPGIDVLPDGPFAMTVCTDVLEHIEPELLVDNIATIARLTSRVAFFSVCCDPSNKMLPDGRNAHLIVQPREWWRDRLSERFQVLNLHWKNRRNFLCLALPKES